MLVTLRYLYGQCRNSSQSFLYWDNRASKEKENVKYVMGSN